MTQTKNFPEILPLLPLRNKVLFPYMVMPVYVGRNQSVNALEAAFEDNSFIVLAVQKNMDIQNPSIDDLYETATIGNILQLFRMRDGTYKALINGVQRIKISETVSEIPYFKIKYELKKTNPEKYTPAELTSLSDELKAHFSNYIKIKNLPAEMQKTIEQTDNPVQLVMLVAGQLSPSLSTEKNIEILNTDEIKTLYEFVLKRVKEEIDLDKEAVSLKFKAITAKKSRSKQKPFTSDEDDEQDEFIKELNSLEHKIKEKNLSDEARDKLLTEFKKLKLMPQMSAEATVIRNYIDWVLSLPWNENNEENNSIKEAEKILNEDHYGMNEPKKRILEHLAVKILSDKVRGPVLCFTGPPGVGKTSLAKSVARACGRKFVRISLGGVRDEAEIRGHRRTYIGALPGKIIQAMKKAGNSNPVFLLDEIDKLSSDFRGDPSSALLEVLDPEQNKNFNDHYIELDYDLSNVLFIATANFLDNIPWALRDRMEIIALDGYTEWEKLSIAKKYLIPKQLEINGLAADSVSFTDGAITHIINRYTREAGVRNLERMISSICRKHAFYSVSKGNVGKNKNYRVTVNKISKYLGNEKFDLTQKQRTSEIGVASGLAVTSFGGDLLLSEASAVPGKGNLLLTGKLGEVMQESARAAMSYVRSRVAALGLPPDFYEKVDIHVHFPQGAIPKDGPSAGITMATAIISALLQIPVKNSVAMTGEITLRGKILKIGGLKQKIIAAHRSKVKTVIIPKSNIPDLEDVPSKILDKITVIPVEHMDEVIKTAFLHEDTKKMNFDLKSTDWRTISE